MCLNVSKSYENDYFTDRNVTLGVIVMITCSVKDNNMYL